MGLRPVVFRAASPPMTGLWFGYTQRTALQLLMPHLLIVDGREEDRDVLQLSLESRGFKVSAVCDGAQALERAAASRPDLIISDIFRSGMNGFELCRQWHADEML